ncbi:P-type conjugative transfer protein VirB9 (plasmid) [Campylobacter fetus]|uniref:P-type conjugative transfer protein VirB9 n=1 Tax=Campylobacter fetus TaxID=196 RepID=A0A974MRI5_CAMFE|nr:P-type conjugative transfer protein VirB9 [Campylobacter fetus]OCS32898.1 P-type conjugative transfer protein VirB9 [Campylobacter fetus subsp. venerealis]QMS59901.1 P-type conjugative transfer protein VirB9 [Campylobacter fetus]
MKKSFFTLLILALLTNSLFALNIPKGSKFDKRVTYATYNADDVFLIRCKNGYVSMLEFGANERIVNIATGFSNGWEIIDKENFLFIKPKAYVINATEQQGVPQTMTDSNGDEIDFQMPTVIQPNAKEWDTNLIVTTTHRIYLFDLKIDEKINYKVQFNYPQDKKLKDKMAKMANDRAKQEQEELKELEKETSRVNVPRNWDFLMHVNKGSDTIAPDFAYDDGVFTYLGFNSTKTIPSIFLFDEQNKESILNTHLKKDGDYDVLVVHKTANKILLRSGDKLVGIFNNSYAKNPLSKTYDTTKLNIEREIIDNGK